MAGLCSRAVFAAVMSLLAGASWAVAAPSDRPPPSAPPVITDAQAQEIATDIATRLRDTYPLPKLSEVYIAALEQGLRDYHYHGLTACALAGKLTQDLRAAHNDKHLQILCESDLKAFVQDVFPSDPTAAIDNGIEEVSLNPDEPIAYIRSSGVWRANEDAFELLTHAMNMAAHAKYVIIDIRDNPGGSGDFGNVMASYFFDVGEAKVMVASIHRDQAEDGREGTFPYVPGHRLPKAKVYILVTAGTASAAEGFAFGLQRLKRATIIGQTTAGAGIASVIQPLSYGLGMILPNKLIVAPGTDKGWEGVGVIPDVVTEPGKERDAAMKLIEGDLAEAGEVEAPEVLPAPKASSIAVKPPVADHTKATLPHLEACQKKDVDLSTHKITITNLCGEAIRLQYLSSLKENLVYEVVLQPGEAMRTRYMMGVKPDYWWIWSACPNGYYSSLELKPWTRQIFEASRYTCEKKKT